MPDKHDKPKRRIQLKHVNDLLLAAIIIICLYIVITPILPTITFWWQNRGGTKAQALTTKIHTASPKATNPVAQANSVTIPSMLLDQPILEGTIANQYKTLDKGIWRWPNGSTPDKGGNTILIGHRFTYTNPRGVFYHMDKVAVGDEIGVTWNNKHYVYKVNNVKVVPPTDVSIEDQTTTPTLTLFTCTPLWWPENRLVITADLETSKGVKYD